MAEDKKTWVSAAVRDYLLNSFTGNVATAPSFGGTAYLALSTTEPRYGEDGSITGITEPSKTENYARFMLGDKSGKDYDRYMRAAKNGATDNIREIKFNQAKRAADGGSGWGIIGWWAIYPGKEVGSGAAWIAGELDASADVEAGTVFVIKASSEPEAAQPSDEKKRGDFKIDFNKVEQSTAE